MAALGCFFVILVIFGTFSRISTELPKFGFYSIRELHIMLREVAHLGDAVTTARLAPNDPESLAKLTEANDLVYIRFERLDRSKTITQFPEYGPIIGAVNDIVVQLDGLISNGQPFNGKLLARIETEISAIEAMMNEKYYAFGNEVNLELVSAQRALNSLAWQIAFCLLFLSVSCIGTAIMLVNRHESVKTLRYLASHDQITGLRNRNWMALNGDQILNPGNFSRTGAGIAVIDLDRFKEINDNNGHHIGDGVLALVGKWLLDAVKEPGMFAVRLGGDEFAILSASDQETALDQAVSLFRQKLGQCHQIEERQIMIDASIGIARFPSDGSDLDTLLRNADHAVYVAKTNGRGKVVSFSDKILEAIKAQSTLEGRLKQAMETGELYLEWQPQFELGTGRLTGAEALARWRDAASGLLIPPSDFIPAAENGNIIRELDRHILRLACETAARMPDLAADFTLAVNLSGKSLQDLTLPDYIGGLLKDYGLPYGLLEAEITEGVFIGDKHAAASILSQLQTMGLKIAIDDFGTGYSNLGYLFDLNVNRLKIDRSFVTNIENTTRRQKLVKSILTLADSLDIEVVAEGVENEAQMDFLATNGCRFAQGFYLSHPLNAELFLKQVNLHASQERTASEFRKSVV